MILMLLFFPEIIFLYFYHFSDVFCSENLLNCEEKVDWKDCKLDKEEEIEMVKSFRKKFQKYDFTL